MKPSKLVTALIIAALPAAAAPPLAADIVADIASLVPDHPHSYAETMTLLKQLDQGERIRALSLGNTSKGRTLVLTVTRDPQVSPRDTNKLLIIARQHGNEPSSTEAVLALLRHLATAEGRAERALLRRVTILAVPMANPDGASAMCRGNGAGVDLNRDWAAFSQMETQAIERVYREWLPDAVIDLHELPAHSSKAAYQDNFVETIGTDAALPAPLSETTGRVSAQVSAWMGRYGFPLNCYYDTPGDDLSLCHRHFGLQHHVPSYLFESKTGRGRSLRERARYHILGMLVIANHLAYHQDATETIPAVMQPPLPVPPRQPPPAPKPTEVRLLPPVADESRQGRALLRAELAPGDGFAYLTFELNGAVVALTNQAPYEYSLEISRCKGDVQELGVRCYDAYGRCLAYDTCSVRVQEAGLVMGE